MSNRFLALGLACSLVGIGALDASADWSETFDNGTYDQTWSWGGGPGSAQAIIDVPSSSDDYLSMTGGANSFARIGLVTTGVFTDVKISGWVNHAGTGTGNFSSQTDHYLLARAPNATSSYALIVDWETSSINLGLAKISSNAAIGGTSNPDFYSGPNSNQRLWAEFTVFGETTPVLTGRVYDAPDGTLLDSITWTDTSGTPYVSGLSGIAALPDNVNSSIVGSFDTISSAVPEPASLALVACGGVLVAARRRQVPA